MFDHFVKLALKGLRKNHNIFMLPNISRSNENQTIKFGQLIKYIKRNVFPIERMQKMGQESQFQTSFCFLKKLYMRQKQVVYSLVAVYFESPQLGIQ